MFSLPLEKEKPINNVLLEPMGAPQDRLIRISGNFEPLKKVAMPKKSEFVIPGTVVAFFLVAMYWMVYLPRKRTEEVTGREAGVRFSGIDLTRKPQE